MDRQIDRDRKRERERIKRIGGRQRQALESDGPMEIGSRVGTQEKSNNQHARLVSQTKIDRIRRVLHDGKEGEGGGGKESEFCVQRMRGSER